MQFLELEPLLAEAADALAATGARAGIGRIAAQAANLLESATPAGVAAGVAASAMAVKRPFGMLTSTAKKAGKRIKRTLEDGLKPKRLLEDIEQSLSPAHKKRRTEASTPGMARKTARAMKSRAKRVTKKTVKKKRTSTKKKAKATRKKSVGIRKNVVHRQQPHGSAEREDVMYMGFQHHGGRDEILEVVVDSVLRKYLGRFAIAVDNPDTPLPVVASTPSMSVAQMYYQPIDYDAGTIGTSAAGTQVNLDTTPYQTVVGQVALELKTQLRAGKMPHLMVFRNDQGAIVYKDKRFADVIVNPTVSCILKLRNITPNDSAAVDGATAGDRFALDTNPLQGKLYRFNGDIPIVRNALADVETDSNAGTAAQIKAGWGKWMDAYRSKGVCGTDIDATYDPQLKADQILSSPPVGQRVFNNCSKTTSIALTPGGSATHKMSFAYKGTLYKFLRNVVGNGVNDFTKLGNCTWLGLEQMYSSKGEIGSGHDKIRVEYDAHYTLRCGTKLVPAERSPSTVDSNTINF